MLLVWIRNYQIMTALCLHRNKNADLWCGEHSGHSAESSPGLSVHRETIRTDRQPAAHAEHQYRSRLLLLGTFALFSVSPVVSFTEFYLNEIYTSTSQEDFLCINEYRL